MRATTARNPLAATLLAALLALAAGSRFHSARCLALGTACTPFFSSRSTFCEPATPAWKQSRACVLSACKWCRLPGKNDLPPCTKRVVRSRCDVAATAPRPPTTPADKPATPPAPAPATAPVEAPASAPANDANADTPAAVPSPSVSPAAPVDKGGRNAAVPAGACTWEGDDAVVISLGEVTPAAGWTPVERDGFSGLVYRKDVERGISGRSPAQGEMCFPVRVSMAGDYFLTFVSYAPEKTEHNDAFVKTSKALRLQRTTGNSSLSAPPNRYRKAYIANGADRGMASVMLTVDNLAHRFIVLDVAANERFEVCIAGRSTKFEVFRIVLQRCFFRICTTGNLWKTFIYDLPVSRCV